MLLDASFQPARTCHDPSTPTPGCSCSLQGCSLPSIVSLSPSACRCIYAACSYLPLSLSTLARLFMLANEIASEWLGLRPNMDRCRWLSRDGA
jgi:hypothetical protein